MQKLCGSLLLALVLWCSPAAAQVNPGTTPLSGPKGGTNNAFMQFSGPASSIKTYSLPNTSDTIATIAAAQSLTNKTLTSSTNVLGGVTMGLGSDATGDIYYNNGGVLTRLPKGSNGQALELVGGLPVWATLSGVGTVTTLTSGAGIVFSSGATCTTTCTVSASNSMGANKYQVFAAGTSGTITVPTGAAWAKFTLQGGGGGGGGGGTGPGNGTSGNSTCLNTTGAACSTPVYQAGGGGGGASSTGTGGAGGAISGTGTCTDSAAGTPGEAVRQSVTGTADNGGMGGNSPRGGAGSAAFGNSAGTAAAANTGSGGQGGGAGSGLAGGPGGGAGAWCVAFIQTPASTYTYAVAASAGGGAAGTSGSIGGNGAGGNLIAEFGFN